MGVSCAICLQNYEEEPGKEIVAVRCGHTFHKTCISEWKFSSKQMSCPECRAKYTERTLKKLYLNIVPINDDINTGEILDQLQAQRQKVKVLEIEKQQLTFSNQKYEYENITLKHQNNENQREFNELKGRYDIKFTAFEMLDEINNKYIEENNDLRNENLSLKRQLKKAHDEIESKKAKFVTEAKPFVDLTNDDDYSDVELIEEVPKSKASKIEVVSDESEVEETTGKKAKLLDDNNSSESNSSFITIPELPARSIAETIF